MIGTELLNIFEKYHIDAGQSKQVEQILKEQNLLETLRTVTPMEKGMTYSKAQAQLEKLVSQMEGNKIPIEDLPSKVQEARNLIQFCESSLRTIKSEMNPRQ